MAEACEEYKALLMGFMDNELTPEEAAEVNNHLTRCASCRNEYDELLEASSKLERISFALPSDKELKRLWKAPYNRFTRLSGLFFVLVGVLVLVGYGGYQLFVTRDLSSLPKTGIAAVIIGVIILFIQVVRDRVITYKSDPYKEIER